TWDAADHGANQAVLPQRREIIHGEEFDRLQSHFLAGSAEVFEADFWVAPFANGMVDAAFERAADCRFGGGHAFCETGGDRGGRGADGHFAKRGTTGNFCFHKFHHRLNCAHTIHPRVPHESNRNLSSPGPAGPPSALRKLQRNFDKLAGGNALSPPPRSSLG